MLCLKYDQEQDFAQLSQRAQLSLLHVLDLPTVPLYGYDRHVDDIQPFLRRVEELMRKPPRITEDEIPVKEVREHLEKQIQSNHPARFIRDEDWAALHHAQVVVASLVDRRRPTNPQIQAALTFCRNIIGSSFMTERRLLPPANRV
jgi:hypothetical protein